MFFLLKSKCRSLELLFALGALDEDCELTLETGERVSELPLHPFFAKMLLAGIEHECVREMLTMVALLSVRTIFQIPPGRRQEASRNVFRKYKFANESVITSCISDRGHYKGGHFGAYKDTYPLIWIAQITPIRPRLPTKDFF